MESTKSNEEFLCELDGKIKQHGTYTFLVKIFSRETGLKETEVVMSVSTAEDINKVRQMTDILDSKKHLVFG